MTDLILRASFLAGLALALAACSPSNGAPDKGGHKGGPGAGMPPPEVTVVTVAPQALPVTFEYVGQTAGSREVEVRSRVAGILLKRNFTEGAPVRRGQSLYTVDPAPFEAAVARAEADVGAAEARLEQARKNAARLKPLYAEKAVSQKDYDDTVSAEEIGAADVKAARARLTEAKLNLSYTKVESPVSGITGRSMRQEGSLISGPDALLTSITQVDPIWVNFGVPDNEQAQIQKEVKAKQLALPDGNFEVALRRADGSLYEKTGRLNFADVRKFVYLVNEKNQAEPRPVEAGEWAGQSWIITGGLKPGERVIVDGVMRLGPGAPVRIAEAKPEAAKPPVAKK